MTKDWRSTLFAWDGILSFIEKEDKENENETGNDPAENGSVDASKSKAKGEEVKWVGTWVGCDYADATKIPTPRRGAFDEFVSSENKFEVEGTTTWASAAADANKDKDKAKENVSKETTTNTNNNNASPLYRVTMTNGPGYDLGEGTNKKKHKDDRHDMYFSSPTLRWTGNLRDQVNNMVFALGENEFGNFISVGWLRVGNRVTLARRYLDEGDERCKWDVDELRKAVFDQIIVAKTTTTKDKNDDDDDDNEQVTISEVVIPPWQCAAMHADPGRVFKRQKIEQTDE